MDIGKDILLGYTGGMAFLISDWDAYTEFFNPTSLEKLTIIYKMQRRLIKPLLN